MAGLAKVMCIALKVRACEFGSPPPVLSAPHQMCRCSTPGDGPTSQRSTQQLLNPHPYPALSLPPRQVRGYGMSGDGHHITAPHPAGDGAVLAMARALAGSGVPLEAVAYINAHATSTPVGDEIEQQAIARVFGHALLPGLAVSSTKGATGHLLGAAGAVEAAFTVLALLNRMAPPTANLVAPDPPLLPGLVGAGRAAPLPARPVAALCNAFGFGGTNASLLLATPPE
jgi:3-oxoacyl-[acyl-carrier-protein] synthase II